VDLDWNPPAPIRRQEDKRGFFPPQVSMK
jgi:hypothetical protein